MRRTLVQHLTRIPQQWSELPGTSSHVPITVNLGQVVSSRPCHEDRLHAHPDSHAQLNQPLTSQPGHPTPPAVSFRAWPCCTPRISQCTAKSPAPWPHQQFSLSSAMQAAGWPGMPSWPHSSSPHSSQVRHMSKQLSRKRVPKSAAINDTVVPNTTTLKFGQYGIRALTGKRVQANTIEAVRRTLRRRLKKTAALWIRIQATVPVTRKPEGIRMGKGKGHIEFYATPVRPGQIIFEMDRVPRQVALSALEAIQPKFPCKLGFVEWN